MAELGTHCDIHPHEAVFVERTLGLDGYSVTSTEAFCSLCGKPLRPPMTLEETIEAQRVESRDSTETPARTFESRPNGTPTGYQRVQDEQSRFGRDSLEKVRQYMRSNPGCSWEEAEQSLVPAGHVVDIASQYVRENPMLGWNEAMNGARKAKAAS